MEEIFKEIDYMQMFDAEVGPLNELEAILESCDAIFHAKQM